MEGGREGEREGEKGRERKGVREEGRERRTICAYELTGWLWSTGDIDGLGIS